MKKSSMLAVLTHRLHCSLELGFFHEEQLKKKSADRNNLQTKQKPKLTKEVLAIQMNR